MKKLVVFAVLAAIVASCADDNLPQIEKSSELVSPRLLMDVSTESGQSPLTGILTIMPCKAGTSIYYGNYINRKLTPFTVTTKLKTELSITMASIESYPYPQVPIT